VNQTKSKLCEIKESIFLGFTIVKNRIKWTAKSQAKFEARLREITKRTRGVSPCQVMEELQLYVRGAVNYYTIGMTYAEAREVDGWLRRRVRLCYWKHWGARRAEDHAPDGEICSDSGSVAKPFTWQVEVEKAHGPAVAGNQNSKVRTAMTNEWLDQQGVPSIANQWINIALAWPRPFGLHFIPAISLRSVRYPEGPKGRPENP
jgi:RNA-directed DNA polymerase